MMKGANPKRQGEKIQITAKGRRVRSRNRSINNRRYRNNNKEDDTDSNNDTENLGDGRSWELPLGQRDPKKCVKKSKVKIESLSNIHCYPAPSAARVQWKNGCRKIIPKKFGKTITKA